MKAKKYTIEDISLILLEHGWVACTCNNEKNGEPCFGTDTIQVQTDEDLDYFGEFVGNNEDGYTFIFYT